MDSRRDACARFSESRHRMYLSRIPNQHVLDVGGQKPYSRQLLLQQLELFGKVARAPVTDPLRALTFTPGTVSPANDHYIRNIGRPRNEWAVQLQCSALEVAGQDPSALETFIRQPMTWTTVIKKYCM